jgi:PAS domain S-box-containing protein
MTLPAYLPAFLSLPTLALAFFCWRRRHLAVAPPLATLSLCLALTLTFTAFTLQFLLAASEISDPALALTKILFWGNCLMIAGVAVVCSTLWLVLSWRPLPWPASWQRLLTAGLALLFLTHAYQRLFQLELLVGSIDYDPGSHLLLFQLTVLGKCWALFWGLIQLTSLSWLLLNWIRLSSPTQRQQAKWLLLSLSIPLLLASFPFLPAPLRSVAFLYFMPWLLASMPLLVAWALFRTGLLAYFPYYQNIVFQRMPAAGLVLDQQQRILALNPPAEQLFQTKLDQVEGQLLSQVIPVLRDATDTVIIDGENYGYEISPLSDRAGQSSGQLVRLLPRPSPVSVLQLHHELGLEPEDLKIQLTTSEVVEFNYWGDLVFQYTTHFSTTLEMMKAFSAIMDQIIEASQKMGKTGLYLIIDSSQQQSISRPAREYFLQQLVKSAKSGRFAGGALINPNWFVKQSIRLVGRLQPNLKLSSHLNQQDALAHIRQHQRQSVDRSEFLQWWQQEQETMPVGDQSLKLVRRPDWVCETETTRMDRSVIEGETLVVNVSGVVGPDIIEPSLEILDQLQTQLGGAIRYRIIDATEVTAASYSIRIKGAAMLDQRQENENIQTTFIVPPASKRGLAKIFYGLLSPAIRQKTQLVDNLDQALQQLYGPVKIPAEVSVEKLNQAQLQQKISQYQQQADRLAQQLSQMLWRTDEADPADGLKMDSDTALGDLAGVIEVVQSDLKELLTERDQRQSEVERTALELAQLIDLANAPIFGVDTDGLINEWNQQVAQTTGYSKEEVMGQNLVEDYITQEYKDSVQQVLDQALSGTERDNYQVPIYTKDGREVVILLNATTRRDTQGQIIGVVGVGQDITELNQYRQELEHIVDQRTDELRQALDDQIELTGQLNQARQTAETAQQEAEEANQAKSQFLSRMSHEIRTPMHGVMGSLDLLQLDSLSPAQQQQIGQAQTSAEHLLEVIDEILDFSRLEAGQTTYQSRPFDLAQTCQQVLELLQPLAQQKGLRLQLEWTPDLAAARQGDQQKLRQVLINLLANAIKFSTEGSIRLKVQPLTAERLRLEVVDTGPGIPAEEQQRLFEAFSQLDETATRAQGGTGLGLSISMQFVQGMGGKMGVESQLGQGATFWLELPLSLTDVRLPADTTEAEEELDLRGLRVLVVDDEAVNRSIASEYLQRAGCVVEVADDGQQALDMFQAEEFDLILMDLQMPRMDGYQASRKIRRQERMLDAEEDDIEAVSPVVIIALSASVVGEVAEQCRQAGMDDYVSKPFRWEELQATIGRHLQGPVSLPQASGLEAEDSDWTTEEAIAWFQPDQLMELGGLELVQEISTLAVTTIGRDMEELAQAIQTEDWSEVRRLSHRMKGAAANSGAQRMSALAARMEDQAQSQAAGQVKEIYPQLVEIWQQTQAVMQDWLAEISV